MTPDPWAMLDRRTLLAAGAGAAALAALAPAVHAAVPAKRTLDPASPEDARKIIAKLRYRTDDGLVFWWIKGEYYADVDATLTPLYGMDFGSLQRVTQRADGGFDVTPDGIRLPHRAGQRRAHEDVPQPADR